MDYTLLLLLALAPLLIVFQIYFLVLRMSQPEKMMHPIAQGLTATEQQIIAAPHREWLAHYHFQFLTAFQFGSVRVAVFQQQGAQRFLSFYFHQKLSYSIETYFDDLTCLDTSTSGSTGMFPVLPGNYKQSFPNARVDEAWERHMEAEDYLVKRFGLQFRPLSQPYEQTLVNAMTRQMKHVRSHFLWPFRALGWYAFRRGKMANKSIQELYP